jgi:ESS family glutamate:Na+ symporter
MELQDGVLRMGPFLAVTLGIIVLFVGKRLNEVIGFLREFSIPEPVTGGLLFSIVFAIVFAVSGVAVEFDLAARDVLLVYFFTTIGINASLRDLLAGGKPLVILLAITLVYMVVQNLTGVSVAALFDLPAAVGVLGGTMSLIGGHGTAIAWAPNIAEDYGISNAMEIGIASATFGLILASLMGGPIAKFLISRHNLTPDRPEAQDVGLSEEQRKEGIGHLNFLDAVLAIHLSAILGLVLNDIVADLGLKLPLFVTCLFAGIILTNSIPKSLPRFSGMAWPSRTPAMALIADISLGCFLAMSLMSLQLWTLIDLAGPIFTILAAQFVIAVGINIYVIFPAMGRNFDAAVVCAGFGGISLGSTPTAMANMSAVTQRFGASHLAFIVVPLVCAFFIDLANALLIPFFLATF